MSHCSGGAESSASVADKPIMLRTQGSICDGIHGHDAVSSCLDVDTHSLMCVQDTTQHRNKVDCR